MYDERNFAEIMDDDKLRSYYCGIFTISYRLEIF